MNTTVIKSGAIFSASGRMDAPYYLNDAVAYYVGLEKCPYELTTVGEASNDVFFGNIFSRCFVKDVEHGVPYLRASEIQKADLNVGGLFLSKKQASQLGYLRPKRDWILVTCSGTLGKCVYTDARYEHFIATHDLIRIVPRERKVLPGVLYAFLSSKFGFATLTHSQYGSVILHTNPEQVKSIRLPVFPITVQRKVHEKIVESARLREESDTALKRAVTLFEHESSLNEYPSGCIVSKITYSDVMDNGRRLDAKCQLGVHALDDEMNKIGCKRVLISDVCKDIFIAQRGRRVYVKKGIPFLSTAEMGLFNPYRHSTNISPFTVGIREMVVHEDDILVSCDGTTGRAVIVGHDMSGMAVSHGALRLIVDPDKISPKYLFCFLRSSYAKSYMEVSSYGSVIQHINDKIVGSMTMPVFKGKVYDSIVADIGEYKEKLAGAADLENEAIDIVEREIESWQGV